MQLLASLGEDVWDGLVWPPYASMVLIELHKFLNAEDAQLTFRLVYNEEVLTSRIPGCDSELCDTKILIDLVSPFATRAVECVDPTEEIVDPVKVAKSLLSKTGGVLLVILVVFIGATIGGVVVVYRLTGTLPDEHTKNRNEARIQGDIDEVEMTMSDASPFDPDEGEEATSEIIDFN